MSRVKAIAYGGETSSSADHPFVKGQLERKQNVEIQRGVLS
jgi:hypothetical protein